MKKLFYILIFLSFACFSDAKADKAINARCKPFVQAPHVVIKVVYEPLRYDHSKSPRTLENLHRKEYGGTTHDDYRINGLTPYNLKTTLDFNMFKKVFNDGVTCFYPGEIHLTLTLKDPVIYIARDVKNGTCAYDITMRHEQTHEAVNLEALEYYIPKIRDGFLGVVKKYAVAGRQKDDIALEKVQESLQKKYFEALNPILEELQQAILSEQSKFDTVENYNYESSLCYGKR